MDMLEVAKGSWGTGLTHALQLLSREARLKHQAVVAGVAAWCAFLSASLLFLFCFHWFPVLVSLILILALLVCLLAAALAHLSGRWDYSYIFLLCCTAILAGSVVGRFNYSENVHDFWSLKYVPPHLDVLPEDLADLHRNASAMVFAVGAQPDGRMTGVSSSFFSSYCVAPVLMRYEPIIRPPKVQYWAAGVDCCSVDGEFSCSQGQTGFVIRRKHDVLHRGYHQAMDQFANAAAQAVEHYGLEPVEDPIFLHWVEDLDAAKYTYWRRSMLLYVQAGLATIVPFLFLGTGSPLLQISARRESINFLKPPPV